MYRTIVASLALALVWSTSAYSQQQNQQNQNQNQQNQNQNQNQNQGNKSSTQGSTQGSVGMQGSIGQTPWFADQSIRQQFKWNDDQYNRLNTAYQKSYSSYQQELNRLNSLPAEQRQQRMSELQGNFWKDFSTTTNEVITDPQQRQRYNQLYLQYRGYGAFEDPMIAQKLNLTDEQRQKLRQFGTEWSTQMGTLGQSYRTDREGATKRFQQMQSQSGERINSVLTPEQQRSWREMTGESYQFQPGVYFQGSTSGSTGNSGTNNKEGSSNNKQDR